MGVLWNVVKYRCEIFVVECCRILWDVNVRIVYRCDIMRIPICFNNNYFEQIMAMLMFGMIRCS